ncbi:MULTISPECIES: 2-oxoacid:acceptor oxidoreductase subunit alpha [Acidobacterium]|uniref:2-oxoacid:ferredoxin/flavodoxin oxidoreductase gamma subunit family protein n=1 Tax=Acidobacterium capsulatum (strain ATCC 51196 / DSM 11244 / BCRC 80197 / JCM 7670 / NBRC 15755 / NCIMB 13165 / 161) TaxID=240015 RepID=C1F9V2_ACIC5|nr:MULTISPECIES: 2-oxoacid:acceptor oxidoreductase subunit alpha [Acidobacterium]ACO33560.1 2-oxoacid:ferredoxin/flavodoxin oxidoreductase gamma subunit family protein [Acidobacterium capsulatum ATCC 51196]HCT61695.1 2-oxoacid:acceptor oxidoreductase subunit alpha [Acidobacterium sp.]
MATTNAGAPSAQGAPTHSEGLSAKPVVNDFSIQVATVNGSGSQSANNVLLRSIFAMGIPVSGKNLFPSNIAGLPTWYTIRASKQGYIARKKEIDVLIAMNAETAQEDIMGLHPGAVAIYDESLNLQQYRDDVICYPVPFDKITAAVCPEAKLRKLVKNMVYVGVAAKLFSIDIKAVETSLRRQFAKKQKAADLNWAAVQAGYEFATNSLVKADRFQLERMHANEGKIIIDGNAACALGAIFAGVTVVTWYPITPSSSVVEQLIDFLKKYRIEQDGKASFAVVQAEDELAAIGMVLGAGWAGARSMTATSGPGISLMAEFAGLGYFAELPGVIFDIQRVGPSTGLPTRTAQGDILSTAVLSHGDSKHVLLLPGSVAECFEFGMAAFDLTERLQTPIFVLSDLDLGMNNWMSDPFQYPEKPLDRGKVLTAEDLNRLGEFHRYKDVDGDAIPYRTLPGTDHPKAAYFTRGSGHNESAKYTERADDYQNLMERLARKFETARTLVPHPVVVQNGKSKVGIIAYGTSDFAVLESRDQLKKEHGVETDYLRLRAYPFTKEIHEFVASHDRVYIVEQNRDAQMLSLLKLDLPASDAVKLRSIRHFNGLPIDARSVTDEFILQEGI